MATFGSHGGSDSKESPAVQGIRVQSLGWEDSFLDERRQGAGDVTWNCVLLEKEGERSAQLILVVWGAWERPCGTTLHLQTSKGPDADEPLDFGDVSSWAKQGCSPSIHNSLAAVFTSNYLPVHGDAERKWDKADTTVTLKSPPRLPLPDCP